MCKVSGDVVRDVRLLNVNQDLCRLNRARRVAVSKLLCSRGTAT
jgi:hypothetical protein